MPSSPWHPKLPTSAKARRMLKDHDDAIEMASYNDIVVWESSDLRAKEYDSRFIIGTVAARLCREIALRFYYKGQESKAAQWWGIANQWDQFSDGEDWQ